MLAISTLNDCAWYTPWDCLTPAEPPPAGTVPVTPPPVTNSTPWYDQVGGFLGALGKALGIGPASTYPPGYPPGYYPPPPPQPSFFSSPTNVLIAGAVGIVGVVVLVKALGK